jgi:hypothetical protein
MYVLMGMRMCVLMDQPYHSSSEIEERRRCADPQTESCRSKEIFGPAQKKRLFQKLAQKKPQATLEKSGEFRRTFAFSGKLLLQPSVSGFEGARSTVLSTTPSAKPQRAFALSSFSSTGR